MAEYTPDEGAELIPDEGAMAKLIPYQVAQALQSNTLGGGGRPREGKGAVGFEGAVMVKGWLVEVPGTNPAMVRFYTDSGFTEWLEVPSSAILHQVPGAEDPDAEKRSIIWVRREARITLCRSSFASSLETDQDSRVYRDPTVARQPR
jgi:hypothetical protein